MRLSIHFLGLALLDVEITTEDSAEAEEDDDELSPDDMNRWLYEE